MKKKMIQAKALAKGSLLGLTVLWFAACQQGFDSNELFMSDVSNSQLESPAESDLVFSRVFNADGSQSVKVTWPVVKGASGYECVATDVTDPSQVKEVAREVVDGTTFLFERLRDTEYKVSIRTLGKASQNNKDAVAAVEALHSTFVQPMTIPSGDLATGIRTIIDQYGDPEYIFQLEAGGEYVLDSSLDFGASMVTLTSPNDAQRPVVKLGASGVLRTAAGLTVEHINFDCGLQAIAKIGVVELSDNPPASLTAEAQGIESGKSHAPADCYVLQSPVILQHCAFKNVHRSLFNVGVCSWGVEDVRVIDCLVQLDNDGTSWGDAAIINGCSTAWKAPSGGNFWYGGIRNITLKQNTIYNIQESAGNNRMIRFANKDLDRVFPTDGGSAVITDNTFSRVYTTKEFGNNTPNKAPYAITFNNNVCYDIFRLQKFIQGSCTLTINVGSNALCGVTNPVDGTDKTRCGTEETFKFAGPIDQPIDLSQPNGGVNFKADGAISSTVGDPRWLK